MLIARNKKEALAAHEERIEGIAVTFYFSKKARLLRVYVSPKGQIKVAIPRRSRIEEGRKFFLSKIDWVKKVLAEIKNKTAPSRPKLSAHEFLDRKIYLVKRCKELAALHNFKIGTITLRRQKSIWGSCSPKNNISLNYALVYVSDELIDYVILHELVHTKIKDHSKKFWRTLEDVLPGAWNLSKKLRNYSAEMVLD